MEDKASLLKELRKETGCLVFMRSEKEDAEGTAVVKGPSFKVGPLSHLPATLVVLHDRQLPEGEVLVSTIYLNVHYGAAAERGCGGLQEARG